MVDVIAKNSLRGKGLERYREYKAHKYRQIAETKDYITIRSFYPMNKGTSAIQYIIDIRYYKNGKTKDIRLYDIKSNGYKSTPREVINFSREAGCELTFVNLHGFYKFIRNFKTHLNIGPKSKFRFEHVKFSKKLNNYGLLLELYLDNRFSQRKSRYTVDSVAEIIESGYRIVFRITDKEKYRKYGRAYLISFFRS